MTSLKKKYNLKFNPVYGVSVDIVDWASIITTCSSVSILTFEFFSLFSISSEAIDGELVCGKSIFDCDIWKAGIIHMLHVHL